MLRVSKNVSCAILLRVHSIKQASQGEGSVHEVPRTGSRCWPARVYGPRNTVQAQPSSVLTDAVVRLPFSPYPMQLDDVDREILIDLLAEALMRDSTFRPNRRHWAADADRCQI